MPNMGCYQDNERLHCDMLSVRVSHAALRKVEKDTENTVTSCNAVNSKGDDIILPLPIYGTICNP